MEAVSGGNVISSDVSVEEGVSEDDHCVATLSAEFIPTTELDVPFRISVIVCVGTSLRLPLMLGPRPPAAV
jgi:hypothetical protein